MQEEEIRMSIHLPYLEDTNGKLRRILKSHKIRSNFYTESILRKLLCKLKDGVDTEEKTMLFMKLTVVIAKQFTLVNLKGL